MRYHSLASCGSTAVTSGADERKGQKLLKARLLAAGASLLALGIIDPSEAEAVNIPGVWQHAEGLIAINLFEVAEGDPPAISGADEIDINAGGHALAEAIVSCAESATCAFPGAVFQYAHGSQSAANSIIVDGGLSIGANALAEGGAATAAGIIQIGLWQVAAADEAVHNEIAIGGLVDVIASGSAIATTGSAVAFAGIGAGISQIATSIGIDGTASNSIDNSGAVTIAAEAVADAALADAAATAFVGVGIYQEANGQELAGANFSNNGSVLVEASASASCREWDRRRDGFCGRNCAVCGCTHAAVRKHSDLRRPVGGSNQQHAVGPIVRHLVQQREHRSRRGCSRFGRN